MTGNGDFDNSDKVNWKDEGSWVAIALVSGALLAALFLYLDRFPGAGAAVVVLLTCLGFYLLSILLRLQNHRGEFWLGRTIHKEGRLKIVFPIVGFAFGFALLFL
jgi:hypothetical protein